jgi:hypothetical protein
MGAHKRAAAERFGRACSNIGVGIIGWSKMESERVLDPPRSCTAEVRAFGECSSRPGRVHHIATENAQVVVVPGAGAIQSDFVRRGMCFSHDDEFTTVSDYRVRMDSIEGGSIVIEQSASA